MCRRGVQSLGRGPASSLYDVRTWRYRRESGFRWGVRPELGRRCRACARGPPELDVTVFGDEGVLERAAARIGVSLAQDARPWSPSRGSARTTCSPASLARSRAAHRSTTWRRPRMPSLAARSALWSPRPISREWAGRAGMPFTSHMEFLANRVGAKELRHHADRLRAARHAW